MSDDSGRSRPSGTQAGCASFGIVLIAGLLLSFFGAAVGGGISFRIPLTEANLSVAGSVGSKELSRAVLPNYVRTLVGSNQNFVNQTQSLTIGPAEGIQLLVIGAQPEAPTVDLNLSFQRAQ